MATTETLREQIAQAIVEGFDGKAHTFVVAGAVEDRTEVHVDGYSEPIVVLVDDVVIPEMFGDGVAAGIALDVQAILSGGGS